MCATAGRRLLSYRDSISVEVRSMYRDVGYDPVVSIYGAGQTQSVLIKSFQISKASYVHI